MFPKCVLQGIGCNNFTSWDCVISTNYLNKDLFIYVNTIYAIFFLEFIRVFRLNNPGKIKMSSLAL